MRNTNEKTQCIITAILVKNKRKFGRVFLEPVSRVPNETEPIGSRYLSPGTAGGKS
jgi:hypothetical protein